MAALKKATVQITQTSLFKESPNSSIFDGDDKENEAPEPKNSKLVCENGSVSSELLPKNKVSGSGCRGLKASSLQICMEMDKGEKFDLKCKRWEALESDNNSGCLEVWDYSDSEAAPASSWSTLPNRALMCRPLPVDIGRCTCVIVREVYASVSSAGLHGGGVLYSLYTNEGQGRQDRKLAMAHHKRHNGKSEFIIAQNVKGLSSISDNSFLGHVTANVMGSKYYIWNQCGSLKDSSKRGNPLLAVVTFVPTIATWTGRYRRMRVFIPKHQSMQLKNTNQMQHINGLPKDREGKLDKSHKLYSRVPHYNHSSKQYELDFRDRGRSGLKIQSSVKNFQLTLEENGKQTILQLGRVSKSKFAMDFRYPLTGYQAFCICLASIDSKLCCVV